MTTNNYGSYPNQQQPPSYSSAAPQGAYASYAQAYGQGLPQHMDKPSVPTSIRVAVYSVYAITLLGIISHIFGLIYRDEIVAGSMDMVDRFFGSVFSPSEQAEIEAAISAGTQVSAGEIILSSGILLITSAALITFAIFTLKGHNWARIVLTVYAGFSVLGLLSVFSFALFFHWVMLLDLASSLVAILTLVFLWLPASNTYMRQMRVYSQWQKQRAYMGV